MELSDTQDPLLWGITDQRMEHIDQGEEILEKSKQPF
jgi:hypothetical protein